MLMLHGTGKSRDASRAGRAAAWPALLTLIALVVAPGQASATFLYAAAGSLNTVYSYDTTTNAVTPLFQTPNGPPDDLIAAGPGRILYLDQGTTVPEGTPAPPTGQLRLHDFTTGTDTVIAGGFQRPADLVLDPSGQSVLLTESSGGKIDRVNLATGAVTILNANAGGPNGLAYDGGLLFANIGSRFAGPAGSSVARIDPLTGMVLATTTGLNSVDGLTYDSYSGRLFTASALSNTLYSINPNNLNDVVSILLPTAADGVVSDGAGNLYIGGRGTAGSNFYTYNLQTGSLTTGPFLAGATSIDLTIAAPVSVPEPASVTMTGLGLLAVIGYAARRRRAS